jgi:hypothetical protein
LISDSYIFYEKNHCEIFSRLMANSRIYRNEWRSARTAADAPFRLTRGRCSSILRQFERRDIPSQPGAGKAVSGVTTLREINKMTFVEHI